MRSGVQLRGKERQRYSDSEQFHAATMAWFSSPPAPDSGQFLHSGETTRRVGYRLFFRRPIGWSLFCANRRYPFCDLTGDSFGSELTDKECFRSSKIYNSDRVWASA